jgi:hypothetical protein
MSDCCGDYYVETTVKGATLTEVRGAVEHLLDPKENMDTVEDKNGAVYVCLYTAGHDQNISDAYGLKENLEMALDGLKEQLEDKPISYSRAHLYVYKYEWIEVF